MESIRQTEANETFGRAELERAETDWSASPSLGTPRFPRNSTWSGTFATAMRTVPAQSKAADSDADEDDVVQLREALRAADRAYRAYLTELRQGDVEPVQDWSTWYAEYLLGLR